MQSSDVLSDAQNPGAFQEWEVRTPVMPTAKQCASYSVVVLGVAMCRTEQGSKSETTPGSWRS